MKILPAAIWTVAIFVLSHQSQVPATPGGDKLAHFLAYTAGGGTYFVAARAGLRWSALETFALAAAAAALYGGLDEIHQWFVPGRTTDLEDAIADAFGSVAGSLAALGWYLRHRAWSR